MLEKNASTRYPINDLAHRRWSGRAYDPDRALTGEQIISLLEAARWAPSSSGDEPWRYLVFRRDVEPESWQRALECLNESNRVWAQHAPLLLFACAGSVFSRNDKPNRWAQYDTGAASMSLCLQATALGLMAHQMGGFDADKVRVSFAVPDAYTPMAGIAVGYQLPPERFPEALRERELAPRTRRPLEQGFFAGQWGKPFGI